MAFKITGRAFSTILAGLLLAGCLCANAGADARPASRETTNVAALGELPAAARETLARIQEGGPFPYARDGTVFNNYERLLPVRPRGHYREYTVPQPASRHRGTRRLIVGCEREQGRHNDGSPAAARASTAFAGCRGPAEIYYTEDHYRSFRRVIP